LLVASYRAAILSLLVLTLDCPYILKLVQLPSRMHLAARVLS
jgi:hypothetical protein